MTKPSAFEVLYGRIESPVLDVLGLHLLNIPTRPPPMKLTHCACISSCCRGSLKHLIFPCLTPSSCSPSLIILDSGVYSFYSLRQAFAVRIQEPIRERRAAQNHHFSTGSVADTIKSAALDDPRSYLRNMGSSWGLLGPS